MSVRKQNRQPQPLIPLASGGRWVDNVRRVTDTQEEDPLDGSERRRNTRVPVDFPIALSENSEVTVTVTRDGDSLRGRARDLCKEAVLVEAEHSFPLGTELHVVLELNGSSRPLELSGKVVRMGPRKSGVMAIAFSDISAESQAAIDAMLG